ncbi:MAG: hypothetical protein CXZ00_16335 [Acidobacteria bacterium]|nr:MAG: hypothetical protein CXZ00_16335 [Acidobacteriota bacterium]
MSATIHDLTVKATERAKAASERYKPVVMWSEEKKQQFCEAFASSEPPCIIMARERLDYGDSTTVNFNKIVTMVKIPYYKIIGTTLDEAVDRETDWLVSFKGSQKYDDAEKRIQHFKEQWAYDAVFDCGINRSYLSGLDCSTCPFADKELDYSPLQDVYGSVEAGIQDINRLHSHVKAGKDTFVLKINPPSEDGEPITFQRLGAFREWNAEVVAATGKTDNDGNPIYTQLAPLWLSSRDRKKYEGVGFFPHPAKPVPGYFNLFRGFRAERMKRIENASCSLYLEHVRNVICDGDERLYRYIMAWLAHMIQEPGADKPGTAIAIRGPQGCGKGTLTKWIQAIIGPVHSMKISTGDRLTGRFNAHLMDKVFINADEAIWSGDKRIAGTLKALITESPLDFEQKGVNPISLPSYLRIIFTSNEKWMVPAESDDRRFVVLDCGTSHVKDRPYYNALNEQMGNGGAVELYHTLLEWDYSDVDVRQAPSTRALIAQKLESLPTVDRWWYGVLHRGATTNIEYTMECDDTGDGHASPNWMQERCFYVTQDMYRAYLDSLKGSGKRAADDIAFGRRLKELTGVEPSRPMRGGQRRKGFDFPPLPHCRELFEQFMAATAADLDWPEVA